MWEDDGGGWEVKEEGQLPRAPASTQHNGNGYHYSPQHCLEWNIENYAVKQGRKQKEILQGVGK
jgi:hypothetical protein